MQLSYLARPSRIHWSLCKVKGNCNGPFFFFSKKASTYRKEGSLCVTKQRQEMVEGTPVSTRNPANFSPDRERSTSFLPRCGSFYCLHIEKSFEGPLLLGLVCQQKVPSRSPQSLVQTRLKLWMTRVQSTHFVQAMDASLCPWVNRGPVLKGYWFLLPYKTQCVYIWKLEAEERACHWVREPSGRYKGPTCIQEIQGCPHLKGLALFWLIHPFDEF